MSVCVIVPYAPSTPQRNRLAEFTMSWLSVERLTYVVGTADNPDGPVSFNHPKAINRAAEATVEYDTLMILDADTIPTGDWRQAITNVERGDWAWSMPRVYRKLTQRSTVRILNGDPVDGDLASEWEGDQVSWAGVQIVRRQSFLDVNGWDERFVGWGSDDACFGLSMDTLVGPHVRFDGSASHLWHPQPPSDMHLHSAWGDQTELTKQYVAASGNPAEMRKLRWED